MMRSMFSGVSGLKVHQTRMDVIGNNIANVNTIGYKSQRVTFSDVFSQTISGASSANDETGRGGRNAMQVGLGVNVSSIDMLMTQGSAQRTDNPFDLMIEGSGFLIVGDASGQYFTRAGALRQDSDGNLVIPNGMKVLGWNGPAVKNPITGKNEIPRGEVQEINLAKGENASVKPLATTEITLSGNLSSNDTEVQTSFSFYDSLGNYYSMPITLSRKDANGAFLQDGKWRIIVPTVDTYNDQGQVQAPQVPVITDQNGNKYEIDPPVFTATELTFKTDGTLDTPVDPIGFKVTVKNGVRVKPGDTLPAIPNSSITQGGLDLKANVSTVTQYSVKTNLDPKSNGYAAGTLSGYSIGSDGIITATYTNGEMRAIAQIPLAEFDNPAGLEKVGDNLYAKTTNSGEFDGIGSAGTFNTGVLEMSNVDLSSEFTDMIVTQRGFQANSRIITVSDEMLQELTNLKR